MKHIAQGIGGPMGMGITMMSAQIAPAPNRALRKRIMSKTDPKLIDNSLLYNSSDDENNEEDSQFINDDHIPEIEPVD